MSCRITACDRKEYRRSGLCRRHHYRFITHGDPEGGGPIRNTEHSLTCTQTGCVKPYLAMGLCGQHYAMQRIHGDPLYQEIFAKDLPCQIVGCHAPQVSRGYCGKHYQRYAKYGDPLKSMQSRPKGRGTINSSGYVMVRRFGHPNANKHGRLLEHRYVMAQKLGRPLLPNENVHHINGNRLDNRPENLELWVRTQPAGARVEDLVAWAQDILILYGALASHADFQKP